MQSSFKMTEESTKITQLGTARYFFCSGAISWVSFVAGRETRKMSEICDQRLLEPDTCRSGWRCLIESVRKTANPGVGDYNLVVPF